MRRKHLLMALIVVPILLGGCREMVLQHPETLALETLEISFEGDNSPDFITDNITLPQIVQVGGKIVDISWLSSNEQIISREGVVNRPSVDTDVTLTAKALYGSDIASKVFNFHVIADEIFDLAFDSIAIGYHIGDDASHVRNHLSLPEMITIKQEVLIVTWSSSNESVLSHEGFVTRTDADIEVTLSAKITYNGFQKSQDYQLIVLKYDVLALALETLEIGYQAGDDATKVTSDIDLPMQVKFKNSSFLVSWSSSNENVITSKGVITRYGVARAVTLKATVSLDNRVLSKDFVLMVVAIPATYRIGLKSMGYEASQVDLLIDNTNLDSWTRTLNDYLETIVKDEIILFLPGEYYLSETIKFDSLTSFNIEVTSLEATLYISDWISYVQMLNSTAIPAVIAFYLYNSKNVTINNLRIVVKTSFSVFVSGIYYYNNATPDVINLDFEVVVTVQNTSTDGGAAYGIFVDSKDQKHLSKAVIKLSGTVHAESEAATGVYLRSVDDLILNVTMDITSNATSAINASGIECKNVTRGEISFGGSVITNGDAFGCQLVVSNHCNVIVDALLISRKDEGHGVYIFGNSNNCSLYVYGEIIGQSNWTNGINNSAQGKNNYLYVEAKIISNYIASAVKFEYGNEAKVVINATLHAPNSFGVLFRDKGTYGTKNIEVTGTILVGDELNYKPITTFSLIGAETMVFPALDGLIITDAILIIPSDAPDLTYQLITYGPIFNRQVPFIVGTRTEVESFESAAMKQDLQLSGSATSFAGRNQIIYEI
ncbi:MAG: hypothetical protein LBR37_04420 [Erysipelotrichaceae bacterium]|nr:hypothetical protein [Erysipelotrichaceae bacterium]